MTNRIVSGKFEHDKEYFHVQGGKALKLSQPQQMMSFSGDWVYVKKTSVWFQVYMIFAGFILQKVVFWVLVRKVMQKTRVID